MKERKKWRKGGIYFFLGSFLVMMIAIVANMRNSNIAVMPLNSGIAWNELFSTVLGRGTALLRPYHGDIGRSGCGYPAMSTITGLV